MQQAMVASFSLSLRAILGVAAVALAAAGCQKDQVTSYSVPKESAPPAAPKMPALGAGMDAPPSGATPISWTTPTGWTEQPASGMRVGSFVVDKDGQHADVSIIPLGGGSGGDLANVNRWRGQVGLGPVDESQINEGAEKVSIAGNPVNLYDFAGKDPKTQQPERILGSILSSDTMTWFFKMTGSETLVEQQKPAFKEFLSSVKFQAAPGKAEATEASRAISTNVRSIPGAGPDMAGGEGKPTWQVPAGWSEQPPSAMRIGSFAVTGENGAKADVSVIKLGGMAGGVLANVNRWRSQLGLPPVEESGLDKLITTQDVGGVKVTFVDLSGQSVETGQKARLLAAIVPQADGTWFYKMVGNDQLVGQQRAAFTKFVETAHYPNA
jgi:hypothetical protein